LLGIQTSRVWGDFNLQKECFLKIIETCNLSYRAFSNNKNQILFDYFLQTFTQTNMDLQGIGNFENVHGPITSKTNPQTHYIQTVTSLDLLNIRKNEKLSFGCPVLDRLTEGGIPFSPITEFSGEAGIGKTQLLLSLCLTCQLPIGSGGLNSGCVYLSTEGRIPTPRLVDYLHFKQDLFGSHTSKEEILDRIFLDDSISDPLVLWMTIQEKLPLILSTGKVRLVIIDSITSLFRGEFGVGVGTQALNDRNNWLFGLSSMMKRISDLYDCMFVISNQISCDLSTGQMKPSLGMSWSCCVNQRFFLERSNDRERNENCDSVISLKKRRISVVFSPELPCGIISENCVVEKQGFHAYE
jgi:RecA/RadA recombinase